MKLEENYSKERTAPMPTPEETYRPTPEVQRVMDQLGGMLDKMGYVKKADLQIVQDRMILDTEHTRLGESYDGSDGRPKYNAASVEQYMRDNGIYQPEFAYKAMHEAELLDWYLKNSSSKKRAYTASPTPSSKAEENLITRETLAEMQAKGGAGWRNYYEKNRDKILTLMSQGKL